MSLALGKSREIASILSCHQGPRVGDFSFERTKVSFVLRDPSSSLGDWNSVGARVRQIQVLGGDQLPLGKDGSEGRAGTREGGKT